MQMLQTSSSPMRVKLCTLDQAPQPGKGAAVRSEDGRHWALFNVDGTFHLCEDRCPHMDCPIHDGIVHRGVVTCMWHQWQFDLATGECLLSEHIRLAKHPTSIDNGIIYANLP